VKEVNGDTIYRIASVSKLFTVFSLLVQEGLNLDDFVWQHVPELTDIDNFREITLRMLASHLSGIARDGRWWPNSLEKPWELPSVFDLRTDTSFRIRL